MANVQNIIQAILNSDIGKKFDEIDKRLDSMNGRISSTTKSINSLGKTMSEGGAGGAKKMADDLNSLGKSIDNVNSKVDDLNSKSNSNTKGNGDAANEAAKKFEQMYKLRLKYEMQLQNLQGTRDIKKQVYGEAYDTRAYDNAYKLMKQNLDDLNREIESYKKANKEAGIVAENAYNLQKPLAMLSVNEKLEAMMYRLIAAERKFSESQNSIKAGLTPTMGGTEPATLEQFSKAFKNLDEMLKKTDIGSQMYNDLVKRIDALRDRFRQLTSSAMQTEQEVRARIDAVIKNAIDAQTRIDALKVKRTDAQATSSPTGAIDQEIKMQNAALKDAEKSLKELKKIYPEIVAEEKKAFNPEFALQKARANDELTKATNRLYDAQAKQRNSQYGIDESLKVKSVDQMRMAVENLQKKLNSTSVTSPMFARLKSEIESYEQKIRQATTSTAEAENAARKNLESLYSDLLANQKKYNDLKLKDARNIVSNGSVDSGLQKAMELTMARTKEISSEIGRISSQYSELGRKAKDAYDVKYLEMMADAERKWEKEIISVSKAKEEQARKAKEDDRNGRLGTSLKPKTIEEYKIAFKNLTDKINSTTLDTKEFDKLVGKLDALKAKFKELTTTEEQANAESMAKLNSYYQQKVQLEDKIGQLKAKRKTTSDYNEWEAVDSAVRAYEKQLDSVNAKIQKETDLNIKAGEAARDAWDPKIKETEIKNTERLTAANEKLRRAEEIENSQKWGVRQGWDPKTIEQYQMAIRNIEREMKKLDITTAGGRAQLDGYRNRMEQYKKVLDDVKGKQQQVNRETMNFKDKLMSIGTSLGIYFSARSLINFGRKIVEITGEFELQHRAMQAIIGDIDQANALFDKTVALAVKSPYRIKDLVTYTKQLSAYRVEASKLYDTTKMLADISSGLGVDMGRLILAYGQVKAANYLRGQELRQFSEAGVNILQELADYFSELEGRIISTGEVFDRVSKRMVTFDDVSTVMKRLTEEGGTFYNMQEIQSETLKGQIENLKDSFDIFLNTIGKRSHGTIVKTIRAIRDGMDNVNTVIPVVNTAMISLIAKFTTLKLTSIAATIAENGFFSAIGKNMQAAILASKVRRTNRRIESDEQTALTLKEIAMEKELIALRQAGARSLTPWLTGAALLATGIALLVAKATALNRNLKELGNELSKIASESVERVGDEIDMYNRLSKVIGETVAGSQAREEAIGKINRVYGEYLDFQVTDLTTQQDLADAYDEVTRKMKDKAAFEAYQRGLEKINTEIDKIYEKGLDRFDRILSTSIGTGEFEAVAGYTPYEKTLTLTKKELEDIKRIIVDITDEMDSVDYDSQREQVEIINRAIRQYFGNDKLHFGMENVWENAKSLKFFDKMIQKQEKIKELQDDINAEFGYTTGVKALDDALGEIDDWLEKEKVRLNTMVDKGEISTSLSHELELAEQEAEKRKIKVRLEFNMISEESAQQQLDQIGRLTDKTLQSINENMTKLLDGKNNEWIYNTFYTGLEKSKKGFKTISDEWVSSYKSTVEQIEAITKIRDAGILVYNAEELKKLEEQKALFDKVFSWAGIDPDAKKGGSKNPALEKLNKQIEAVKSLNSAYDKYIKLYSKADASERARADFSDLLSELGMVRWADGMKEGFGDAQIANAFREGPLKAMVDAAGKEGRIAAAKFGSEWDLKIAEKDFSSMKENIQKAFDEGMEEFSLSDGIRKLGINDNLAETLFAVKPKTLNDVRDTISSMFDASDFRDSEELQKFVDELLAKISKKEDEARRENLKKYVKYFEKTMTERVKIEYDALKQLDDINRTFDEEIKDADAERAKELEARRTEVIHGLEETTQKALDEQAWKDFQGTEMYIRMFEDMDHQTDGAIDAMLDSLENLKSSLGELTPASVKAIVKEMEKLRQEKMERNPFKSYIDAMKEVRKLRKEGRTYDAVSKEYAEQTKVVGKLQEEHDKLTVLEKATDELADGERKLVEFGGRWYEISNDNLGTIRKQTNETKDQLDGEKSRLDTLAEELNVFRDMSQNAENFSKKWNSSVSSIKEMYSDINDALESAGALTDNEAKAWADAGGNALELIGKIGEMIILMNVLNTTNPLGWISLAVEAIAFLVKSFYDIKNARIDDSIEALQDKVDRLATSAERVQAAFDKAWDVQKMRAYTSQLEMNANQQIRAYRAMISAEKERKNPDEKQIAEWENTIYELGQSIAEARENFIAELGGIGESEYKSAAQQFVDAWYDAYKETGNGLTGLEDTFNEFFENMMKKQAMSRIAQAYLEPIFKMIDESIGSDGILSAGEIEDIRREWESRGGMLNDAMKNFFDALGLNIGDTGSLSGLTEGIQGVTESTAQIIEGYLNSMRYYSQLNTSNSSGILAVLQDQNGSVNPMLAELRNVRSRIDALYDFMNSWNDVQSRSVKVTVMNP